MEYCQVGALPRVCLLLQRRAFGDNGNQQCGSGSQSQRSANETDLGELCRQMQRRCKRFDTPSRCSKPQLALSCISSTANNKVSKTASRQGLFWNLFLEPEVRFCVFTLYVAFDCVWQVILVKGGATAAADLVHDAGTLVCSRIFRFLSVFCHGSVCSMMETIELLNPNISEIICTNLVHLLRLKRCELLAWEGCIFWNSRPDDSSLSEQLKLTTDYLKMVQF
ncbi:hypothetical protein T4D_3678 [Trichinella pseudospiralis]|uniref:Uncharacterized protein n=1 Tax=Trichinella pseudospiralis TaxID=6337 RepID=A0A0V1F899_TRIPS|nr:hypothetical protein T4D_3678 [Trichinella pseudospiralis]